MLYLRNACKQISGSFRSWPHKKEWTKLNRKKKEWQVLSINHALSVAISYQPPTIKLLNL
jgi:hypothetical protein